MKIMMDGWDTGGNDGITYIASNTWDRYENTWEETRDAISVRNSKILEDTEVFEMQVYEVIATQRIRSAL